VETPRKAIVALAALVALVLVGPASAAVSLGASSSTLTAGQTVTLTATLTAPPTGGNVAGQAVNFNVNSGPNAGLSGRAVTDAQGRATYSYSSSKLGTDHVTAFWGATQQTSNDATVTWIASTKTDESVSLAGPALGRVGNNNTWSATIKNAGPDTATGVTFSFSSSGAATFVSATGPSCSSSVCVIGTLAAGATATVTLVYKLTQSGSASIAASVTGDFETNPSNNTASAATTVLEPGAPPPPPPPPTQPGTFNAIPTGTVMVNGGPRPADQPLVLNSGDTVDVTNGVMTFTAADGSTGNFSSVRPTARRTLASKARALDNVPAQFTVTQPADGVTTLTLVGGDFSSCGTSRSLGAVSKKPVRQLWGSAKGNFRTNGRFATATVRGTLWLLQDRCDGTLEETITGEVSFFDPLRKKTVTVGAGSTYLVALPLKLPAQTPAQVKKRGVLYGGHAYKTRKTFESYLRTTGHTWAEFAKKYPKLAAALVKRR
jgi:Domain of unknown function DUF11